jgi:SSS family solute:Na+ symporter
VIAGAQATWRRDGRRKDRCPAMEIVFAPACCRAAFSPLSSPCRKHGPCSRLEATQDRARKLIVRGWPMAGKLAIVLGYLLATLAIGFFFRKVSSSDRVEFFLAGRKVPAVLLFCSMAATNFSAFTIFGLSGAGYRIGYAFYPVMGFGTGFMALSFLVVGLRINLLARSRGYLTPAHYIADRYGSRPLSMLFSLGMIVFTLPYVALQAISSGKSLNTLVGLPYAWGALLVAGFSVLYVVLGGMRSDVWTDVLQGIMMLVLTLAAFLLIAAKSGGFAAVNERVFATHPGLFARPGLDGSMTFGVWTGYLLLWLFADPMFPQLFQRFMAARDDRGLKTAALLYPLITTFLFLLTVSIGVMGRATFPDLPAGQSDNILPLLLDRYAGGALAVLLMTGGMAALMSTLDSQLLSLGSMITQDFIPVRRGNVLVERLVMIAVGAAGFAIALNPPNTILDFINRTSFHGFAALAPSVLGGLYWKHATRQGAAASILAGEALVVLFGLGILGWPGVSPAIPVIGTSCAIFLAVCLCTRRKAEKAELVMPLPKGIAPWAAAFALLFLLANDFWAWNRTPRLLWGLPQWVWYSILLGIALSAAIAAWSRRRLPRARAGGAETA